MGKKGEEEFSIEVHRLITEQKEKIRQDYEKKVKKVETSYAIAKSMAINKQRLEKIKARQEVMQGIAGDVKKKLASEEVLPPRPEAPGQGEHLAGARPLEAPERGRDQGPQEHAQ